MVQRRMRLLFLDQYGEIGGGQRILLDLLSAARSKDWAVSVLCPEGKLAGEARLAGASVSVLVPPSLRDGRKSLASLVRALFWSRTAARTFRPLAEQCDLLVVNGPRMLAIARIWVRALGRPAALYLHGNYGRLENLFIRAFLALPKTAAIAASPLIASPFARVANVHVIPNWVSPVFLSAPPDHAALRRALGIADPFPVVLVPGRFSPNKGQRLLLAAALRLPDIPAHFVFTGSALFEEQGRDIEAELRAAARRAPDRFHVLRWDGPLPALYDGADLVVVPSQWDEPFGLTAIEAMARRRPLLVTDRGMLPDIADRGQSARVVEASEPALADALRAFFSDPHAYDPLVSAAAERVRTQYDPGKRREEVLAVFASLAP